MGSAAAQSLSICILASLTHAIISGDNLDANFATSPDRGTPKVLKRGVEIFNLKLVFQPLFSCKLFHTITLFQALRLVK
jgi:hypothetical protein